MFLVKWGLIGLLVLPAAEVATFIAVAAAIGWARSTALLLATSVLGIVLLRRSGRGNLGRLREALARDGVRSLHLESPGAAPVLGAILLAVPGFITDLMGAALFVAPVRQWCIRKLASARGKRTRGPRAGRDRQVIDLEPGEWRRLPDRSRRRRKSGAS
ncbi:MAG TPA: FxsA family protein [Xanthobacteraceae bacterium]|jgi:UPF0716 protein FxsA